MIAIVDYGVGNLGSARKGFEKVGYEAVITDDPAVIREASGVVLPGDGAFKDCYDGLRDRNLVAPLIEAAKGGKPFLGICVGMQLLFDSSEEGEPSPGLSIFPGRVVRFPNGRASGLKVPHMGWNQLRIRPNPPCALFPDPSQRPYVYFIHSYFPKPAEDDVILATSEHGVEFPAVVGRGNVFGVQFHPEKSQEAGLAILKEFGKLVEEQK